VLLIGRSSSSGDSVSGFAETDDVKETQKLGAGQYINKPLTLEKMGIAVRDELNK